MPSPKPSKTPDPWSSELEAMREVAETLHALGDDDARRRVLGWAADHFALHLDVTSRKVRGADTSDTRGGGSGQSEESALEVPSERELYAAGPAHLNERDTLEDLIVHRVAVHDDDLVVRADFIGGVEEPDRRDLTFEIDDLAELPVAAASRLDLQALVRGLVDEFDALVKAWQADTACAA